MMVDLVLATDFESLWSKPLRKPASYVDAILLEAVEYLELATNLESERVTIELESAMSMMVDLVLATDFESLWSKPLRKPASYVDAILLEGIEYFPFWVGVLWV
jgi:hypothetical protein